MSLRHGRRRVRGLTLIELMVALVIGMLLVVAMAGLFVSSSHSRREVEISADVIENGRYAIDLLTRELSQAGFYGSVAGGNITGATNLPCSTTVADWADSLTFHAFGWNSGPLASDANPACLNRKAGTDAIFVQRASTCFVGEAGCEAESASRGYMQVSECANEYNSLANTGNPYVVAAGGNAANFPLQDKTCNPANKAIKRKLVRRIYYIDGADNSLKSMEFRLGANAPIVTTLAENIDNMQVEYGVSEADGTGTPRCFTPTPAAPPAPCTAGNKWPNVIGARVWILARSSDATGTAGAATTFQMGDYTGADAVTYPAASANPKRRVYTTYIPFVTPKMRVEQ